MRRRVPARLVRGLVGAALALGVVVAVPSSAPAATVKRSVTVSREFTDATGATTVVDHRSVSMSVSQTTNLRGRQEITVDWSGAHPTGGLVGDVNSADGAKQEYPFVLLECRGVDSTKVAVSKRIRPETCWTQTWSERFSGDNSTGYPAWRSDAYETAADRAKSVEAPTTRPAACFRAALAERWVPFVAANGTTYAGGSLGCAGMAPESSNVGGTGLPSNATYGITGKDGKGSAQFDVWTENENASLGCSSSVPCSLVAIPIEGISCDPTGADLPEADRPADTSVEDATDACEGPDTYQPGEVATSGNTANAATSGALWWSASNWRHRMTVPLSFAVQASVCGVVGGEKPLAVYGTVLMNETTAQWEPTFCTDKKLDPFVHVQTADPAARTLVDNGSVPLAFTSRAPDAGFVRPVAQAPVALSGFAITYAIDDANGDRYTKLRLDARLLAKLLTESYPANSLVKDDDKALAGNPMNLTKDPEFLALNPTVRHYDALESAATLQMLSSDADLVWALTSYIDSDPEARAWLDGTPDPWGMQVNPNYRGITLPVESWPLLDDYTLPQSYIDSQNNPCYSYSPSPYLGLVANPTGFVSTIIQDVQFAISNSLIGCATSDPSDVSSLRLTTQGRQQPGYRFVLGIAPLSATYRYSLQSAALQTTSTVGLSKPFTTAAGRTFVSPTTAGLRAAGDLLTADDKGRTWTFPYDSLHESAGAKAYPGTMLVNGDAPVAGLTKSTAKRVGQLLRFAATTGQHPGTANGDLPPGMLPLSAANGLGRLKAYTLRVADAVTRQTGTVPDLTASAVTTTPSAPSSPASAAPPGDTPVKAAKPSQQTVVPAAAPPLQHTAGASSLLARYAVPTAVTLAFWLAVAGVLLRWGSGLRVALQAATRRRDRGGARRADR